MDKRRRIQNGKQFSNSIHQNRRREENSDTMEGNKNKVSLQWRKQRQDTRKSKRNISDEPSMLSL